MAAEETRASPAPASSSKAAIPKTSRAAATAPVPSSPSKSGFFRLLKGGFRAVSGLIGRVDHEEYRVSTPVATIGLRGTEYRSEERRVGEACVSLCRSTWEAYR